MQTDTYYILTINGLVEHLGDFLSMSMADNYLEKQGMHVVMLMTQDDLDKLYQSIELSNENRIYQDLTADQKATPAPNADVAIAISKMVSEYEKLHKKSPVIPDSESSKPSELHKQVTIPGLRPKLIIVDDIDTNI